ncbi:FadR/GntR family transcriptional regulator [Dyadobacter sp. 3J3]|uniref:FadR/GntR family transcriptional regulator n=1 Tax=Dyadobacter sp. 3J3 TaxID=2606600 RepID=UPI00190F1ABF|nr:FadR/GntR family transcriptional regulator [Dyadobacter sp. 3J3]
MTTPIIRKSLSEEVAERLQNQIQSGSYKLGEKLPSEPELMKEFGVGRSSIREAIRTLENYGILNVQHGVGSFVASQKGISEPLSKRLQGAKESDMQEVRELLEIKIVEKAAINRTDKDITKITNCLKIRNKAADEENLEQWLEADIAFHIAIADACKNPVLTELYKTFAEQQLKSSIAENYAGNISMHRFTELHELLLKSIEQKKPEMAVDAILKMRNKD